MGNGQQLVQTYQLCQKSPHQRTRSRCCKKPQFYKGLLRFHTRPLGTLDIFLAYVAHPTWQSANKSNFSSVECFFALSLPWGVCVCVCVEISFQMPSVFRESRQMWELESEPLLSLSLSLLHFNKLVTLPCSGSISEQNFQIHKRSMWIF